MKSAEYFYNDKEANDFIKNLHNGSEVEKVKTLDEDTQDTVYIVYYIPPKM